jgi:SAM-dependent methyltransferase
MTSAQAAFASMLRDELAPRLRQLGFRGSGLAFSLPDDAHWAQIGIQKSQWSSAEAVRFTVNATVARRDAWDEARKQRTYLPARPAPNTLYGDPVWSRRIGQLLPGGEDRWWELRADARQAAAVASLVADAVRDHVLPAMREQLTGPAPFVTPAGTGGRDIGEPLLLRAADLVAERPPGSSDDIHFTEALAASIIGHASRPGDLVLDPFAGYGTTVAVAARMGRRAIGIELIPEHLEIARRRTGGTARLILGDARQLDRLVSEPVDLVLTSPPYMPRADHPENPLTGYATDDGDYGRYLAELGDVFGHAAALLRPDGRMIVNVGNPIGLDGSVTPLADDIAAVIDRRIPLLGVTTLRWDVPPAGIDGDYLLWFGRADR